MTEFSLQNSKTAAFIAAGISRPDHIKMRFVMSSEMSELIENRLSVAGERKVFGYLKILTQGFENGWVGAITARDLAQHFSNTRRKTTAQHWGRIINSLKKKKMIFTVWVNLNRTIKAHLNLVWISSDASQWEDIFKGGYIYPITVVRFIQARANAPGVAWNGLRRLGVSKIPKTNVNDLTCQAMAKTVATQFVQRMHPDIQKVMPVYKSSENPISYMNEVEATAKNWPAYYGIEEAEFNASERLKTLIDEFRAINVQNDFENHIFASETKLLSSVENTTLDDCSSVENTTLEMVSSGQNTTLEEPVFSFVNPSDTNHLQSPPHAYARNLGKEKDKREKDINTSETKKKSKKTESQSGIIEESVRKKGTNKMNLNLIDTDNVKCSPDDSGFKKEKRHSMTKKPIKEISGFEEASQSIREYDIKTPTGLFDAIRKSMASKHPGFKFNGSWKYNVTCRELIEQMEKIRENGYLDDEVLNGWVSWFSSVFSTPERLEKQNSKFLTSFVETWKMFSRTISRPEERDARRREILAHKTPVVQSDITEIEKRLIEITEKSKTEHDALKTMLIEFGVVVACNWLLRNNSDIVSIEALVRKTLDSFGLMKIRHIYGMTTMRDSSLIKAESFPFSKWRSIFESSFVDAIGHEMESVDHECEEVDRFLSKLTR